MTLTEMELSTTTCSQSSYLLEAKGGTEIWNILLTHPPNWCYSVPNDTQENACLIKSNKGENIKTKKTKQQINNMKEEVSAMWYFYKEK